MRYLSVILVMISVTIGAYAQTPVENVITKFEDVSGARNFVAQGLKMTLARKVLKNTPVASIASSVDEMAIIKMEGASQDERLRFVSDLNAALKSYDYYGKHSSKNGDVDIYIHRSGPETVDELVIYNPGIYSLNSFYGHFTVRELLELDKM